MAFCPFFSLIVFQENDSDLLPMKRLRCKSWDCAYCAKENRRLWAKHLRHRLPRVSSDWWFLTLTAHENLRTAENSLQNIRSNLDRLFKRLRRIYAKIQYVRVFEVHKKGAFHAHLVLTGLSARVQKTVLPNGAEMFRPTDEPKGKGNWSIRVWFRRTCRKLGMGYMVDCDRVDSPAQVVNYVVKYLTKEAQAFQCKNLRRVQTTQQIGGLRQDGGGGWHVKARVFRTDIPPGKALYDADRKHKIPDDYWKSNLTYPRPGE